MSSNCLIQNCLYNCCNYAGYCTTSSSSCYNYYADYYAVYTIAWWLWTIIGVGIFLFVVSVIACIVCCCRACAKSSTEEIIIDANSTSVNAGYNYNTGQNYNYNNGAYAGQPIYSGQPIAGNMEMKQYWRLIEIKDKSIIEKFLISFTQSLQILKYKLSQPIHFYT